MFAVYPARHSRRHEADSISDFDLQGSRRRPVDLQFVLADPGEPLAVPAGGLA